MGANVKYKASVFSLLFSDPDLLRELYGALEGVPLPADIPVTINTLEDVLFKDRINDISFLIGKKLVVLFEHQSTINPNMALRLLIYIARIYEKIIGDKNMYASRLIRIPRPEFFVLYNGTSPYPDEKLIKLSDAFESGLPPEIEEKLPLALDLEVRVININVGRNRGMAERCKTLGEYSAFIGKVREFEKEADNLEGAVRKAVIYCRDHDILKEFLETNATEVLNMLMTEWNWDDALAYRYEEGREVGREEGMEVGMKKGSFNIAQNLVKLGLPIETVISATQLDPEKVKQLYQR
jgi:hypothetical protein